jgi:hypothetical protein
VYVSSTLTDTGELPSTEMVGGGSGGMGGLGGGDGGPPRPV